MVRGALFKLIPFVPRQRCGVVALPASIDLPWSTRATPERVAQRLDGARAGRAARRVEALAGDIA